MMYVLVLLCVMPAVIASEKQHTHQTEIDATRNGSTGIITSPGYPGNYPDNANYTWTLKTGNLKATITLNFSEFNINKYDFTSYCEDYLQINETEPCCYQAMKKCGNFNQFGLTVTGNIITISFVSDNLHNTKGFDLTWKVNIPRTPEMSKTSLWTSKIQMKSSAKIMSTTGPKRLGTTNVRTPTAKTENSIRTSLNIQRTPAISKTSLWTSKIQTTTSAKIIFTTRPKKLDTTDADTPTAKTGKVINTSHTTRKTSTLEPIQSTTQQQNFTTGDLAIKIQSDEIIYLVAGIGVVELTLVALAIYIVRQRRSNMSIGQNDKEQTHPVSRKSVASVGNVYESIPLEHFSIKYPIPEEDEGVYTEVPEHVYDKTFEHRPRVNVKPNLYQLLSELKTKNR